MEQTPPLEKQPATPMTLGSYKILETIGKGGMGEVFLVYDTICGRKIALKKIRTDLISHKQLHRRFLREAHITSQLTHPSIIPIYAIHEQEGMIYYTMPYIEGKTLKQIISNANKQEKQGLKTDHISTIPSLIRIFISICQAVAYAHSKGVIHRDLKPHNVIVGLFGEVIILDWGLAKILHANPSIKDEQEELEEISLTESDDLTRVGRVVGTVAYMAPERAKGQPATRETDIYSLGVMLYQTLTLYHPFKRGTLVEFRQNMDKELLHDPIETAPYRDIPPMLSRVVLKCLSKNQKERYQSVQELLHDLESYIEGRSEWFQTAELQIEKKSDWEFQENVLFAEHVAITRGTQVSDWVSLMISKDPFPGNIKIEARIKVGERGHGIGILLCMPEAAERLHLNDGYCLWISSDISKNTKLLQSSVEVLYNPETFLKRGDWYQLRIEKIDDNIFLYINDILQFSYISHLPINGSHIGILSRDADFEFSTLLVSNASQNIEVKCLAIPDAFLAHKDYTKALIEYRHIARSFPGIAEGREAMFRAGITLLEEARTMIDPLFKTKKIDEALEEFSKLHRTSGAPLEYLGKALIYQYLEDYQEECKCFEIAFRRYPKHPLRQILNEQLIHRMHDYSRYHRTATYHFILLAARYLTQITPSTQKLFDSLKRHWEPLYFQEEYSDDSSNIQRVNFTIQLAFWLAQPYILSESVEKISRDEHPNFPIICNALFSLIELGEWKEANQIMPKTSDSSIQLVQIALAAHEFSPRHAYNSLWPQLPKILGKQEMRIIIHIMEEAIKKSDFLLVHDCAAKLHHFELTTDAQLLVNCYEIICHLKEKDWSKAGDLLHNYSIEQLMDESTPLHFLYGCWLYVTEGKDIASIHFSSILQVTYPRTWTLFSHFISSTVEEKSAWLEKAFLWEKRQLYFQFALFYEVIGDAEHAEHYRIKEAECYIKP